MNIDNKCHGASTVLKKLGLTEEDVKDSEKLFRQIPPPPPPSCPTTRCEFCKKEERLLGYALMRLSREKALKILGTSEEGVNIENAKNLGSLGQSGRRRSFIVDNIIRKNPYGRIGGGPCGVRKKNKYRQCVRYRKSPKYNRRRSTSDLNSSQFLRVSRNEFLQLKRRNEDADAEMSRLKLRLENLENEISLKKPA